MKIGITGYKGRVGQCLIRELENGQYNASFCGGTTRDDDPLPLFEKSDVVIDFTLPDALEKHLDCAVKSKTPLVIGTTGLSEKQEQQVRDAAHHSVIVYAPNMSIGVNMLLSLVEQVASRLDESFDIEILESHHKHKIDAPSGTALALGQAAAKGRGSDRFVMDRTGKRQQGDIGYAVLRGGDVVGEHTVYFYGDGERLELTHKATDRSLFAKGALRAALWTKNKPTGFYTMRDVLEI